MEIGASKSELRLVFNVKEQRIVVPQLQTRYSLRQFRVCHGYDSIDAAIEVVKLGSSGHGSLFVEVLDQDHALGMNIEFLSAEHMLIGFVLERQTDLLGVLIGLAGRLQVPIAVLQEGARLHKVHSGEELEHLRRQLIMLLFQ